jgi:hypothetical protein
MSIAILYGIANATCDASSPLAPWASAFREPLVPPSIQYNTTVHPGVCAETTRISANRYIVAYNPCCPRRYRVAAAGHALAANASYTPTDKNDMLATPLAPAAKITRASVLAMAQYGRPRVCDHTQNCDRHETCTARRCTPIKPKPIYWAALAAFVTTTVIMFVICLVLVYSKLDATPQQMPEDAYAGEELMPLGESVLQLETTSNAADLIDIKINTV